MAFLEQFSDEERELIVSVPYRAGLWVSMADDVGGAEADYKELDQLETIIAEKGRGMFESAFVHEVMAETCTRQSDWRKWAAHPETLLDDCTRVVALIADRMSERDLDAYRMNVMGIGLEVAKAFREFGADDTLWVRLWTELKLMGAALVRLITRDKSWDADSVLNVSYEEDVALSKLSKALHPGT